VGVTLGSGVGEPPGPAEAPDTVNASLTGPEVNRIVRVWAPLARVSRYAALTVTTVDPGYASNWPAVSVTPSTWTSRNVAKSSSLTWVRSWPLPWT